MTFESPSRCDSHQHLFATGGEHRYSVSEFEADVARTAGITSTVHVQARNAYEESATPELAPVGETRWLEGLRHSDHVLNRFVAFADLSTGQRVEDVLEAHAAASPARFAGIRHVAAWSDDPAERAFAGSIARPGLLALPAFAEGIAEVQRRGLTFETWIFQHQLVDFASLAASLDGGVLILDHLGGPLDTGADRTESIVSWKESMRHLAEFEHVRVKLSGIGMAVLTNPGRFPDRADTEAIVEFWGPELRWCIETFGPERCMFGSNFPVDKTLCDYDTLWSVFDRVIADLTPRERDLLIRGTAETTYCINV